jgi:hypothetical protein
LSLQRPIDVRDIIQIPRGQLAPWGFGFAYFPHELGDDAVLGIPLSLWVVFAQFAGTWTLVYAYFRLSRTYIEPADDAAIWAITQRSQEHLA